MTNMNRMNIIQFINPKWHKQLMDFLDEHPTFERLLPIVALDEFPCGFNKNPHESEQNAPLNVFETILWGIAHAGVDMKYGDKQYLQMVQYMREVPYFTENMEFPFEVQEKKIKTYRSLINTCLEHDLSPPELTIEHMPFIEYVEDIADSTIVNVYLLYGPVTDPNVIPHADEYFNKGIEMFYGIPKPTRLQIKAITDTWSNKKVGLMFITQYAHYSAYVKEDGRVEPPPPTKRGPNDEKTDADTRFEDKKIEIAATITKIIHEIAQEELSKRPPAPRTSVPIPVTIPGTNGGPPMTIFMTVSDEPLPPPPSCVPISDPITFTTSTNHNGNHIIDNSSKNILENLFSNINNINNNSVLENLLANINNIGNTIANANANNTSNTIVPKEKKPRAPRVPKEKPVKEPKEKPIKEVKEKPVKPRAPRKKKGEVETNI
uniref:Uncharacterized protein n=1 Tax=viral metagenome TaxID=1070528 RepID=A0A6C0IT45_9ZZZZ